MRKFFNLGFGVVLAAGLATVFPVLVQSAAAQETSVQGRTWAEISKLPDFSGSWLLDRFRSPNQTQDPIPLKPPYDKIMADLRRVTQSRNGDVPSNSKLCMPNGPGMYAPGRLYEFLFTPGQVTIIPQNNGVRRIYTDGRGHPDPEHLVLSVDGHSIGHWEGNALVAETVGLRKESEFIHAFRTGDANKTVTITERFHLTAPGHLKIDATLESPVVFSVPYSFSSTYTRVPFRIMEEICAQNNLAVDPLTGEQIFPTAPSNDGTVRPLEK